MTKHEKDKVLQILDANINRCREALRVTEETFRFVNNDSAATGELKSMRHELKAIESGLGRRELLRARDVTSDPLAAVNRPEEMARVSTADIAAAGLKRAQESARVLEEYIKLTDMARLSETAKRIRFRLYAFEKRIMERTGDVTKKPGRS